MSKQNGYYDDTYEQAKKLKDFIIEHLNKNADQPNENKEISLKDLVELASISQFSQFLREYFKIDSRSLYKRLNMFLLTYPDTFIVNYEAGLVRLATSEEATQKALCLSLLDRCSEFVTLCLSLQPTFLIPIKQLHEYLMYAAMDVEKHLNELEHFTKFLESNDKFYVNVDHVCLSAQKAKLEKRDLTINKLQNTCIDDEVLKKTKFVYNLEQGMRVLNDIQSNAKLSCRLVAFDTEGTKLGENDGILTLAQIAYFDLKPVSLKQDDLIKNIKIFIFDILKCEELITECIAPILANKDIVKIMHDAKNDFNALRMYFKIKEINNVFDTSKLYYKLTRSPTNGLHTIYEEITGLKGQNLKPKMKQLYQVNYRLWESRPLSSFLQFYAAFDVLCLLSIYLDLENKYELENWMYIDSDKYEDEKIYSLKCVEINDEDGEDCEIKKKSKKKKNKRNNSSNSIVDNLLKTTPDQLEKMKQKIEYLEKIARGEIEVSDTY